MMPVGGAGEKALNERNARVLLQMQARNGNVPDLLRAAARRILEGTARAGDAAAVKQYLGQQRGGATALRGGMKSLRAAGGVYLRYQAGLERLGNVDARGGTPTGAVAYLASNVLQDAENVLRQKQIANLFNDAAAWLSETRVGAALGVKSNSGNVARLAMMRNVRLLGAGLGVAAMAKEGYDRLSEGYANEQRRHESVGRVWDAAKEYGINAAIANREREIVELSAAVNRGVGTRLGRGINWVFGGLDVTGVYASEQEQIERRSVSRFRTMGRMRQYGDFDRQDIFARSGRASHMKTVREQERAMDESMEGRATRRKYMSGDENVERSIRRWKGEEGAWFDFNAPENNSINIGLNRWIMRDGERKNAVAEFDKRRLLAEERIGQDAKRIEARIKERHEIAQQGYERMSPETRLANRNAEVVITAAHERRVADHQAWKDD